MTYLKEAGIQIISGGCAGFVEVSIMHPMDLVKTRFQIQRHHVAGDVYSYSGIIDCFKKMYVAEGAISFYKGILPPILVETPKRAVKFFTFEQYKRLFSAIGGGPMSPLTFSLAGLGSGVTEAILVNPFEVVKVRLQSNFCHQSKVPSTWEVTRQIIREEGFGSRGLNKGATATIGRNGVFNMVYFGLYHSLKGIIPTPEDKSADFIRRFSIGLLAGTLASTVNIPFDVAKSRIQGPQPIKNQIKYRSTFQSILLVYREEGFRALYKGLLPKILRLGPGGAIMMVVYEHASAYLTVTFL